MHIASWYIYSGSFPVRVSYMQILLTWRETDQNVELIFNNSLRLHDSTKNSWMQKDDGSRVNLWFLKNIKTISSNISLFDIFLKCVICEGPMLLVLGFWWILLPNTSSRGHELRKCTADSFETPGSCYSDLRQFPSLIQSHQNTNSQISLFFTFQSAEQKHLKCKTAVYQLHIIPPVFMWGPSLLGACVSPDGFMFSSRFLYCVVSVWCRAIFLA